MKKLYTLSAALLSAGFSFAQSWHPIDTNNLRYWSPGFFSAVTITSNVVYGSSISVNNTTTTLKMDIYEPTGDTVTQRPLLIIAHGGTFIGGSKTDIDVSTLCNRFAKMGYVCASIDYRLGIGFPIDSVNATKAVIRAVQDMKVQDMKAAIRFFRKDALTNGNTYKIHPNYIFAGGSSAGAFMGLHLAYLDKNSEVPSWINISSMGGLDGNSGNSGYSHHVNGVINLCGALGDSSWIEPTDVPFVSLHGNQDQTVPYNTAMIYIGSFPIMIVDGSSSCKSRANNNLTTNPYYQFNGADHVPYAGTSSTAIAYMDTTVDFVKAFLRPLLVQPSTTGFTDEIKGVEFSIYPNPAHGYFNIAMDNQTGVHYEAVLMDMTGKIELHSAIDQGYAHFKNVNIAPGIYILRITGDDGTMSARKIIIN
jgi:poly(3-hydroxybutyrate) depolymerase